VLTNMIVFVLFWLLGKRGTVKRREELQGRTV
jgi:hypothetical protein